MQLTVLLAVLVSWSVVSPDGLDPLEAPTWRTAVAAGTYLLVAFGVALANARLGLAAIRRAGAVTHRAVRVHGALSLSVHAWLVGGLAGVLYLGYGRWVMTDLALDRIPLAGKLTVLAPFLVALGLVWAADYPFYRTAKGLLLAQAGDAAPPRRPWTLGQYLSYNCRHQLLFILVPVGLVVLCGDVLWLYAAPALGRGTAGEVLLYAATGASAIGVFLVAPMLIVRVWKTERLTDRSLRTGLEEMCRRLRLRYRDILVWKTDGMIANAGVLGLIGPARYVLLSDGLLENMDYPQVEAVFAHEAGHIASHHIPYLVLSITATTILCGLAGTLLADALKMVAWQESAMTIGLLLGGWVVGFGWVSRRFERQSDVVGAWATGRQLQADCPAGETAGRDEGAITPEGAAVFAKALDSVARLNGIPPRQRDWRHGSIESRIDHILRLGASGATRRSVDRGVRRIKAGIWLMFIAGVAALALTLYSMAKAP